jgi:hypothetical protein
MANAELRAKVAANIAQAKQAIAILRDFVEDENLKLVLTATLTDIEEYEAAGARPRDPGEDDDREARRLQRALDDWPAVVIQLRAVEEAVSALGPDAAGADDDPER